MIILHRLKAPWGVRSFLVSGNVASKRPNMLISLLQFHMMKQAPCHLFAPIKDETHFATTCIQNKAGKNPFLFRLLILDVSHQIFNMIRNEPMVSFIIMAFFINLDKGYFMSQKRARYTVKQTTIRQQIDQLFLVLPDLIVKVTPPPKGLKAVDKESLTGNG